MTSNFAICEPSPFSLLRRANLHGLPALPNELLHEIISHLPADPVTTSRASPTHIARRQVVLSLSKVCHNLRRFFRPCLWKSLEVYAGMRIGGQTLIHTTPPSKAFAIEIRRQLNIVTAKVPDLAQYVRNVNIEINEASLRPVFVELGHCFSLLPNLHTVKIITKFSGFEGDKAMRAAKRGFKKSVLYPQIRSVVISHAIHPLLAVCPNLESFGSLDYSANFLNCIIGIPSLQRLSWPIFLGNAETIAAGLPSLRQITVYVELKSKKTYQAQLIKTVQLFHNLTTLILYDHCAACSCHAAGIETLKQAFLDLPLADHPNLKHVIFSGYSAVTAERREVTFELDALRH